MGANRADIGTMMLPDFSNFYYHSWFSHFPEVKIDVSLARHTILPAQSHATKMPDIVCTVSFFSLFHVDSQLMQAIFWTEHYSNVGIRWHTIVILFPKTRCSAACHHNRKFATALNWLSDITDTVPFVPTPDLNVDLELMETILWKGTLTLESGVSSTHDALRKLLPHEALYTKPSNTICSSCSNLTGSPS